MMKCDMCYDRSSVGRKPMCATVCPSQALFFGTRGQIEQLRPLSAPVNRFEFGSQVISTRVFTMVPRGLASSRPLVDVTAAMDERPRERSVVLRVVPSGTERGGERAPADAAADPFGGIAI
jgi:Fe-S-cluster-containing dehydrogenase component